jgi:hypothetical protein
MDKYICRFYLSPIIFMLAAHNREWITMPMIGFNAELVFQLAILKPNYIPVFMMTVGFKEEDPQSRDYFWPIEKVVYMSPLVGPY